MIGLLDNKQNMLQADIEKLFNAGILYMQCREYAFAYYCFDRIGKTDFHTLYNKALCCHNIEWFAECHDLLKEVEKQLPSGIDCRLRDLPEIFIRWECEQNSAFSPMPYETPLPVATIQVLKLKAENAYKMHLYSEVRNIASRLGGKYKRIDELIKSKQ